MRVLALAERYHSQNNLTAIAQPVLDDITAECGEPSALGILQDDYLVVVAKSRNSKHVLSPNLRLGERAPAYSTAGGKAILAFLPPGLLHQLIGGRKLEAITPYTITDSEKLLQELAAVRERGVAFAYQELYEGVIGIGAPIFDREGVPVGSVSIAVPFIRVNDQSRPHLEVVVLSAARKLSAQLGFCS